MNITAATASQPYSEKDTLHGSIDNDNVGLPDCGTTDHECCTKSRIVTNAEVRPNYQVLRTLYQGMLLESAISDNTPNWGTMPVPERCPFKLPVNIDEQCWQQPWWWSSIPHQCNRRKEKKQCARRVWRPLLVVPQARQQFPLFWMTCTTLCTRTSLLRVTGNAISPIDLQHSCYYGLLWQQTCPTSLSDWLLDPAIFNGYQVWEYQSLIIAPLCRSCQDNEDASRYPLYHLLDRLQHCKVVRGHIQNQIRLHL